MIIRPADGFSFSFFLAKQGAKILAIWALRQGEYKELVSCSNCTDFQSRALDIRSRNVKDEASASEGSSRSSWSVSP